MELNAKWRKPLSIGTFTDSSSVLDGEREDMGNIPIECMG
jgi:hypothetical protein